MSHHRSQQGSKHRHWHILNRLNDHAMSIRELLIWWDKASQTLKPSAGSWPTRFSKSGSFASLSGQLGWSGDLTYTMDLIHPNVSKCCMPVFGLPHCSQSTLHHGRLSKSWKKPKDAPSRCQAVFGWGRLQLEPIQFLKGSHCNAWILVTSHGKAVGQGTDHLQQLREGNSPWISNAGGDWKADARTSALGHWFKMGEKEKSKAEKTVLWTTLNLSQVTAVQRVKNFAPRVILASVAQLEFDDWSLLTIVMGVKVGLKIRGKKKSKKRFGYPPWNFLYVLGGGLTPKTATKT